MKKYMQYIVVFLFSITFLVACGGVSDEDVVEKTTEAMDEVESFSLDFDERETNSSSTGSIVVKDKGDTFRIDYDQRDSALYGEDDEVLIMNDGIVQDVSAEKDSMNVDRLIGMFLQPMGEFESKDDDFVDHIEVEQDKDKEEIKVTYVGDEEEESVLTDMGEEFLKITLSRLDERDFNEIDISEFGMNMIVDADTYLLKEINFKVTYEEFGVENKMKQKYTYNSFDDIDDIEELEVTEETTGLFGDDSAGGTGTDLDADVVEGAGEYVEALIYATVFQDEKGFVKHAPDSMSEEDAKEEAKVQKEAFRDIYIENTQNNMAGLNVSDEQIDDLTDAFLKAINQTDFKILTSTSTTPESVVVSLSVKGMNDTKVYENTDKAMNDFIDKNEGLPQDEIIEKNFDTLIEQYGEVELLEDPVELDVNVTIQNGKYMVMLQDEYLTGFVQ